MNSIHSMTQEKYRVEKVPKSESECTKPQPGSAGPALLAQAARSWPCRGWPGHVVAEPPGGVGAQGCRVGAQPARPCTPAHPLFSPVAARPRTQLPAAPVSAPTHACSPCTPQRKPPQRLRASAACCACACAYAQLQQALRARPYASQARLRPAPCTPACPRLRLLRAPAPAAYSNGQ